MIHISLMNESQDPQTTQNLPISQNSEQYSPSFESSTTKKILILSLSTSLLIAVLSYLSLHAIDSQSQYSGSLSQYLPLRSAEIQYSRVPHQYWDHRLRMIKAMGLNSVSTYIMWNFHQKQKGQFDFTTNNKNLTRFLELTQEHNLSVLIRPGPYVCAQWDFGGLPARLLGVEGLQIRSANALYEAEVETYFQALAPIIRPFLIINGGNIIMLQIQNQFGYFGKDNKHILNLLQMWKNLNISSQFYLQDPGAFWQTSYWQGAHLGLSQTSSLFRYTDIQLSPLRSKDSLIFGGEIYSGWFTEWGWNWGKVNTEDISQEVKMMIERERSFSLYMDFGGTNFGVTAGANGYNGLYQYLPHITSYDYDSPINEMGRPTEKYHALRNILQTVLDEPLLEIPQDLPSITFPPIKPTLKTTVWSNLPAPSIQNSLLTYFQSSQLSLYNQGLALYETTLTEVRTYSFILQVRDVAFIFIDDVFVEEVVRRTRQYHRVDVKCGKQGGCRMRVLVQAMGHINFGKAQTEDRKGLILFQEIGRTQTQIRWTIYAIPIDKSDFVSWPTSQTPSLSFPAVYELTLNLQTVGDTYIDMQSYKKGYLAVNGHLLGRYWDLGPQTRLYCPGVWLKKGDNVITILQLMDSGPQTIRGQQTLREDQQG